MKHIKKLEDVGTVISKARKKPVIIDYCVVKERCYVQTREGTIVAGKGDVIIRGIEGEVYPCDKEIFFKTYDFIEAKK